MQNRLLTLIDKTNTREDIPALQVGDTVVIHQKLLDGAKERIQTYEGDVIARSGGGPREMITVRKIVQGEGVERIFPIHSPRIARIEVKKAGKVRRAKLYYIRERVGKAVKIRSDVKRQAVLDLAAKQAVAAAAAKATEANKEANPTGESKRAAKRKAKAEAEKKK